MTREERQLCASAVFALVCAVVAGMIVGNRFHHVYMEHNEKVPVICEEDEYLYFDDYKGPGENNIEDLICVHVDAIDIGSPLVIEKG